MSSAFNPPQTHSQKGRRPIYIPFAGPILLETPLLNKGSAFSAQERAAFNLEGLLPHNIETIDEQVDRVYHQFSTQPTDIDKHIYLRSIQDANETLYFKLVTTHLEEIMPLIYTPTVGHACQRFSQIYRRKRGLFISYPDRERIDDMLQNATKQNVKVIVVTDGERILGLGDQGIGGMGIPIGKLALYTACGGISPAYTLPIVLDVGCNNKELIADPMYMGWRHARIQGADYYEFVDLFIQAVRRRWPSVLLQFEDFAQANAMPLLERYQDAICCFNDDIQGTASVAVGTLMSASRLKGEKLKDQTIVFAGGGSAGCGIASQIVAQMIDEGLSEKEARGRIYLCDRPGLLTTETLGLAAFQKPLVQDADKVEGWADEAGRIGLEQLVERSGATVLIGVSGQRGLFTEDVVRALHAKCARPIILPLSNPTSQAEATPADLLAWTNGEAIVGTGSPFAPVMVGKKRREIAQCNNSYIFPGIGLGVLAVRARRVTDGMFKAASHALAESAEEYGEALLPPLSTIREVSKRIARAVAFRAIADGVALEIPDTAIDESIERNFWTPAYRQYRRTSF